MFNCISQIENLYGDCDLLKIWESFPTRYQTSNDPCDHIIYNQWIERTPALLDVEMIIVNNKNAHAEDQWNLSNINSSFDEDDIMNDPVLFKPPYVYQRKDMFKFFYHIGLISMFDIGFQQAVLETDKGTASQNYTRNMQQYNRCPMALLNETFFREKVSLDVCRTKKVTAVCFVLNGNLRPIKVSSVI